MTSKERAIIKQALYRQLQESIRMVESWTTQGIAERVGVEAASNMIQVAQRELSDVSELYKKVVENDEFLV